MTRSPIIQGRLLSKAFGAAPLFRNVSFTVSEGDRTGLIGPNGSGKSTLLKILAGELQPDGGDVAVRKRAHIGYAAQDAQFQPGDTVRSVVERALKRSAAPEDERRTLSGEVVGRAGFEELDAEATTLSGGWQKRLAIVEALVQAPDVVLLDEPTNHLDLAGIAWLEAVLKQARFACVVVSHDRYFLENVATAMVELNRVYPDGSLRVDGNYSRFLEAKEEFLHAQAKRQEALENRVRREIEWLRRGPKARTTKSRARIDRGSVLTDELAGLVDRGRTSAAEIDFSATHRRTRRLIELDQLSCTVAGRSLFERLTFVLATGTRVGLVGPNGSGKTTLLRMLRADLAPTSGSIRRADGLRIVYFDQNRRLDTKATLQRALAPEGDSVVYQDRLVHVASWAARFLFTGEQLVQPVGRLSGGEQARVKIAQLMLQPADVLLLDEPTNDLDIPTLEVLEESLLEFSGSLVLVTHDRHMLDRVSTLVLGLDGRGGVEAFADYSQWESWRDERERSSRAPVEPAPAARPVPAAAPRRKLSYLEAREYAAIEERIAVAEQDLAERRTRLEDPAIASDAPRLLAAHQEIEAAQKELDALYVRWEELDAKSR